MIIVTCDASRGSTLRLFCCKWTYTFNTPKASLYLINQIVYFAELVEVKSPIMVLILLLRTFLILGFLTNFYADRLYRPNLKFEWICNLLGNASMINCIPVFYFFKIKTFFLHSSCYACLMALVFSIPWSSTIDHFFPALIFAPNIELKYLKFMITLIMKSWIVKL